MCQIQGCLEICNSNYCDFISFLNNDNIKIIRVKRNSKFFYWMLNHLKTVNDLIKKKIEPIKSYYNPNPVDLPKIETKIIYYKINNEIIINNI